MQEVTELERRVARLEDNFQRPSVWKLVSERAGLIALALTIVIGAATVFDRFIAQPRNDMENTIEALAALRGELEGERAQGWGAYEAAILMNQVRHHNLLDRAIGYARSRPTQLTITQLLFLATEFSGSVSV